MQEMPPWKPLLIIAVLVLSGLCLYPPSQRLKPGLDLAGGTTLVYQVDVPKDQDPTRVVEQVIETLKKRVDPNGVRNLIWRRQAGNRIEIQMALPPTETSHRRDEYLRLQDALFENSITKRQLDSALRVEASQRGPVLEALATGHTGRRQLLAELELAYNAMTTAQGPYLKVQEKFEKTSSAGQEPPAPLRDDLIAKTRAYLDAKKTFEQAQAAALATNVDPNELDQVLSLPTQADGGSKKRTGGKATIYRDEAFQQLLSRHSDQATQIEAVSRAKALYEEIRGPLDDPNDLIALLRGSGVLEFRVAAQGNLPGAGEYRERLAQLGPRAGTNEPYRWLTIDDPESFADSKRDRQALEDNPVAYFAGRGLVGQMQGDDYYVLLSDTPGQSLTQRQQDWKLTKAYPLPDDNGFQAVGFELNRVGGELMGDLTGNSRGRPMAIVLDGRVISTPTVNDRIQDRGIITGGRGGFSQDEQSYLMRTLNAGSLQGRLGDAPIYIKKFGPQLGQDNLNHGLQAAVWSLVAVAVLMTVYYFSMGLVANFALAANMVIILGAMSVFDATFTLPGIAGIVLTIGMAVDANVLIFERIREELASKADVRTSVRLGYDKALSSIIDANVTTLITCVILFYTATAEIKGFAITLMIGILASMFTALFCTRVIVDLYVAYFKPRRIVMLPTAIPAIRRLLSPSFDWVSLRHVFFGASVLAFIGGLTVIIVRGGDLLDIEFKSGTQVSFELAKNKTLPLQDVRQRLTTAAQDHELPSLAGHLATVVTVGQVSEAGAGEFSVSTLETDAEAVSTAIKEAFADVLDVQLPVEFVGMGQGREAPPINSSPVYALRRPDLGSNINRPDVREDVTDYLGGVAIVLDQMSPAPTIETLNKRVRRMQLQPSYEALGYRPMTVVGLDLDPAATDGQARYRSAVVVVAQEGTNYIDEPEAFVDPAGLATTQWRLVHDALRRDTSLGSVANFSSQVSATMQQQAIVALTLSLLAVVVYVWLRFGSLRYGFAAIVALVHDVVIAVGLVALAGWLFETSLGRSLMLSDFKVNLAMVAAVLTIVGYSLNDTIIIFDRIRENRGRLDHTTPGIINDSINQTFSRSVMTSVTTLLAVGTLYVFGGDGVHGFAFAMLVGVAVGTYSSVAIAAPVVLLLGGGLQGGGKKPTATGPNAAAA